MSLKRLPSLCLLGLLATASASYASTITYTAGNTNTGATGTFTTSANTLTISLSSLDTNPTSAAQELSGITFTLSTTPTTDTISAVSGSLIDIASNGSYTSAGAETLANTHFGTSKTGAVICLETAGSCAQGGKPEDLIIGTAASYPASNPSITGHDPQIQGTATFTLALTGITSNTTITGVTFNFGTGPDSTIVGTPSTPVTPAPEPSSLMLFGTGILGLAGVVRRRLQ